MSHLQLAIFLARRLVFSKNNNYAIKVVGWVCMGAIAIGSFALTLIFAIMQGFQTTTEGRLQNIHPQVILQAPTGQYLNFDKIKPSLDQNQDIYASTPYALSYGVLHNPNIGNQIELQNISLIKGINPLYEDFVTKIESKLEKKSLLQDSLINTQIIIGTNLAKNLGLKIGNRAQLWLPSTVNTKSGALNFKKVKIIIGNIIKTGICEFDDSLILVALDFAENHFSEFGICEIGVKLKPSIDELKTIQNLNQTYKLRAISWKELYAPIIATLKLEKYTALAIAMLIILIASITLIALLFMLITKHTGTIAIITILGLDQPTINRIFTFISMIITIIACTIGTLFAILVGLFIQNHPFITLPDTYYISTLPIELSASIFMFVFFTTNIMALLAAQIPLRLSNKINLAILLKANN